MERGSITHSTVTLEKALVLDSLHICEKQRQKKEKRSEWVEGKKETEFWKDKKEGDMWSRKREQDWINCQSRWKITVKIEEIEDWTDLAPVEVLWWC